MPYWALHEKIGIDIATNGNPRIRVGAIYPDLYAFLPGRIDYARSHLLGLADVNDILVIGASIGAMAHHFSLGLASHLLADRIVSRAVEENSRWAEDLFVDVTEICDVNAVYGVDAVPLRVLTMETILAILELQAIRQKSDLVQDTLVSASLCFEPEIVRFISELYQLPTDHVEEMNATWIRRLETFNRFQTEEFVWEELAAFQADIIVARLSVHGWINSPRAGVKVRQQIRANTNRFRQTIHTLSQKLDGDISVTHLSNYIKNHLMQPTLPPI